MRYQRAELIIGWIDPSNGNAEEFSTFRLIRERKAQPPLKSAFAGEDTLFISEHAFERISRVNLIQLLPKKAVAVIAHAFQHWRLRTKCPEGLWDDVLAA